MKRLTACMLAVGFACAGLRAQIPSSVAAAISLPAALALANADLGSPAANAPSTNEEVHLENAPLPDAVKFLANQADLRVLIDPKIITGHLGAGGQAIPPPNISVNLTNVTPRQALDYVLTNHGLMMIPDPNSGIALVTETPGKVIPLPSTAATNAAPPVTNALPPAPPPAPATNAAAVAANVPPAEQVVPKIALAEEPILDTIDILAQGAKINYMLDPKLLSGTNAVSTNNFQAMTFYNTTYRQALEAILDNNDLTLVPDPKTQIARITRRPPPELEPLMTDVIQLKYSSPSNIVSLIQSTLPTPTRTRITADIRTSQIIVSAPLRDLYAITNLVAELDTPTKQVLIEAQLLETSQNPKTVRGIDWKGTLEGQNVSFGNGSTTGTTTTQIPGAPTTTALPSGRSISATPGSSVQTALQTALGSAGLSVNTAMGFHPATAFLNADGVRAELSFLNEEADTKVLATPRAVTLDNEPARLEVTRAFPIFQVSPGAANVPAAATITYTNLGTILTVTPRIAANSNVDMEVVPEVSNIDSVDTQFLNGQENTANIYAIRKVKTRVTIPSGDTLVMGGLISDSTSKSYTKVPLLGDIPGFGLLFRHESNERKRSNLLIFITPTIITDNDYQPNTTGFLQTPPPGDQLEPMPGPLDRGKPKQWFKKRSSE